MPEIAARILAAVVAATFLWAGVAKLLRPGDWRSALAYYRLEPVLQRLLAPVVPAVELAVGVLLLAAPVRVGAALSIGLLSLFSLFLLRAQRYQGRKIPCGCFGRTKTRDFRVMAGRNAVLGAFAGALLIGGAETRVVGDVSAPEGGQIAAAGLVALGIAAILWTGRAVGTSFRKAR